MFKALLRFNLTSCRDKAPLYIFHTQQPAMLIQVHHEALATAEDNRFIFTGNYDNSGVIETISFTVESLLICEPEVSEELRERVNKVLNKAWHWYVAYLNWQDDKLDNSTNHDH